MLNAFTVDVEDWYQTQDFNFPRESWNSYTDRVAANTTRILNILDKTNTKGTFFVLGCIAKKHPQLVKEIDNAGHEIASHGMWHRMVSDMPPEEFRLDTVTSKKILEDITGKPCNMFRAPTWSINEDNLWALEILNQEGFICDSSMQPFKTPLSGSAAAQPEPFYPVLNGQRLGILEFPPTILKYGKAVFPFSGGLYFRFMPSAVVSWALKQVNKTREGMVYIHPWEVDPEQPRVKSAIHIRLAHYYNIKGTEAKLESLLQKFKFTTLGNLIEKKSYRDYPISPKAQ